VAVASADHIQIISTSIHTDNHASSPHNFFTGQMVFLTPNQQCQSTEGNTKGILIKHIYIHTEELIHYVCQNDRKSANKINLYIS